MKGATGGLQIGAAPARTATNVAERQHTRILPIIFKLPFRIAYDLTALIS
jgi:hypothetical protein